MSILFREASSMVVIYHCVWNGETGLEVVLERDEVDITIGIRVVPESYFPSFHVGSSIIQVSFYTY